MPVLRRMRQLEEKLEACECSLQAVRKERNTLLGVVRRLNITPAPSTRLALQIWVPGLPPLPTNVKIATSTPPPPHLPPFQPPATHSPSQLGPHLLTGLDPMKHRRGLA